jgi:muconolactone delta-isomerase
MDEALTAQQHAHSVEALTMEFLVTMTTNVPDGTSDAAVQDIRTREAAHSQELAAQGSLLRLWRPPLQPGEWRTLGLFAADDGAGLEEVLASMPLRVWRSDEVTPLLLHPNDPTGRSEKVDAPAPEFGGGSEFLTTFTLTVPVGTPGETVDAITAREADRTQELAGQGYLLRLWRLPGKGRALGLWRAQDVAQMQTILASLPMYHWLRVQTTPLHPHPSDPLRTSG